MLDIRKVTDDFSVSPQISPGDMATIAAHGFRRVICNRPDGEEPGQPDHANLRAAAAAAGLEWVAIPIAGRPDADTVEQTAHLLARGSVPTLAFCRSGTRSITVWVMANIASGALSVYTARAKARAAGYNLG